MTAAPELAVRMRGLRGAVAMLHSGRHPTAAALFADSVPAVVALDDDDVAALTAVCCLEEFTPQECRTQQCETLEVDIDSGHALVDVIIDIAQPLTDFEPVWRSRRGASSGVDEAVEHEKRGERGRFEATIRACDESFEPPGRGPSVPVARRNVELAPHRTNSTPRDTGESCDDSRAHLEAKEAFGERERTYLAINGILGEGRFHGATRLAEQYAACAPKSRRESSRNHQIWPLTRGSVWLRLPLFYSLVAPTHA